MTEGTHDDGIETSDGRSDTALAQDYLPPAQDAETAERVSMFEQLDRIEHKVDRILKVYDKYQHLLEFAGRFKRK